MPATETRVMGGSVGEILVPMRDLATALNATPMAFTRTATELNASINAKEKWPGMLPKILEAFLAVAAYREATEAAAANIPIWERKLADLQGSVTPELLAYPHQMLEQIKAGVEPRRAVLAEALPQALAMIEHVNGQLRSAVRTAEDERYASQVNKALTDCLANSRTKVRILPPKTEQKPT